MTNKEALERFEEAIRQEGFRYGVDQDRNGNDYIKMGFNIDSRLTKTDLRIIFRNNFVLVYAYSPLKVDQDQLSRVARYITMANFGLKAGGFEMDYSDGEVRYKVFLETRFLDELPHGLIMHSIRVALGMMERYGDGLATLMMGYSDPETEIEKAESQ